jgi:ribosome-interacting GTPase 1
MWEYLNLVRVYVVSGSISWTDLIDLLHHVWAFPTQFLHFISVPFFTSYTKPKGQLPDYTSPVVLRNNKNTVEDFCNGIHKYMINQFK